MKRRRFLRVTGSATVMAGLPTPDPRRLYSWQGQALGAQTTVKLIHDDRHRAQETMMMLQREVERMDRIFSLYRRDSALTLLNRDGYLESPPSELVTALRAANAISYSTNGAFDVSIQPLWQLHASGMATEKAIAQTRASVDFQAIQINTAKIRLAKPHMALTMNGIAQGLITDHITERLAERGLKDILVNMGEFRATGFAANGNPWQIAIHGSPQTIALQQNAIATSSPQSLDGHLIDPQTGYPTKNTAQISMIGKSALIADAASTAASVMGDRGSGLASELRLRRIEVPPGAKD